MADLKPLEELRSIVAHLRGPEGCPWDREQTHASLRGALVEECYEVVEAITRNDTANLREELGDLLLHIVMQAQIAEEAGDFTLDDVASEVSAKMIRRHPHVFGNTQVSDSGAVVAQWDEIKRQEKGRTGSLLQDIPHSLPALLRAQTAQKKAAKVGFDWESVEPVFEKIDEEVKEIRGAMESADPAAIEDEVGDLLFSVVNLARKLHVDAEVSLSGAAAKFIRRFQAIEGVVAGQGRAIADVSADELNQIWDEHKRTGLSG